MTRRGHSVSAIRTAEAQAMSVVGDDALMQIAADGLAEVVRGLLPANGPRRVLIAAGPGNNGGDALFAGARLAREGVDVHAWRTSDTAHTRAWIDFAEAGGREVDAPGALIALPGMNLVVDGVLGIGGRPGLPASVALFAEACRDIGADVVAVDLPSGLDADSGHADEISFEASHTVTFGAYKRCQLIEPARGRCGQVSLVDIGLDLAEPDIVAWESADLAMHWPIPDATSDKYSRGVVGFDTGSDQYPGAGLLGVLGAVYSGAGMVRSRQAPGVRALVRATLPNVVFGDGRVQALVLGSGWGDRADGQNVVAHALDMGTPLVLDADGLTYLPPGERHDPSRVLLTPHAGELARLLGLERAQVADDPMGSAHAAAERYGATVLLKGATQFVAEAGARTTWVAVPGPAWTAQAGSGDVLAGICGTLLAAGLSPREAALAASSVQAMTAAHAGGPYPPQDIARRLPETIATFGRR